MHFHKQRGKNEKQHGLVDELIKIIFLTQLPTSWNWIIKVHM